MLVMPGLLSDLHSLLHFHDDGGDEYNDIQQAIVIRNVWNSKEAKL